MKTGGVMLVLLLAAGLSGCANPGAYWVNRGRDAADIFTATCVAGLGASARLGPLACGLTESADLAGLRGGKVLTYKIKSQESMDVKIVCFGFEWLAKKDLDPRAKNYIATTGMFAGGSPDNPTTIYLPFVGLPYHGRKEPAINWSQMTQCDVQAACIFGFRLGFNPGELIDFLLGWAAIDLYHDDLEPERAVPPP